MDDGWSVPHCRLSPIGCPVPGSVLTGDDHEAKGRFVLVVWVVARERQVSGSSERPDQA